MCGEPLVTYLSLALSQLLVLEFFPILAFTETFVFGAICTDTQLGVIQLQRGGNIGINRAI